VRQLQHPSMYLGHRGHEAQSQTYPRCGAAGVTPVKAGGNLGLLLVRDARAIVCHRHPDPAIAQTADLDSHCPPSRVYLRALSMRLAIAGASSTGSPELPAAPLPGYASAIPFNSAAGT